MNPSRGAVHAENNGVKIQILQQGLQLLAPLLASLIQFKALILFVNETNENAAPKRRGRAKRLRGKYATVAFMRLQEVFRLADLLPVVEHADLIDGLLPLKLQRPLPGGSSRPRC